MNASKVMIQFFVIAICLQFIMPDPIFSNTNQLRRKKMETVAETQGSGYLQESVPFQASIDESGKLKNVLDEYELLEEELARFQSRSDLLEKKLIEIESLYLKSREKVDSLQEQVSQLQIDKLNAEQKYNNLKTQLLKKKMERESRFPRTYEIQEDDSLWKIAAKPEIYNDPYRWVQIYNTNKDNIEDPDVLFPGLILKIERFDDWDIDDES